jgi:hypothetical protein
VCHPRTRVFQVVKDVVGTANDVIRVDHPEVSLDEFCELTGDDNCDLMVLVDLYREA